MSSSSGVGRLSGGAQRQAADSSAPESSQPVAASDRRRLVREPDRVERREEEVARLVAREHAAGAIAAVRRGSEADDQDPRRGIAERRERASPSSSARETPRRIPRGLLPPRDEPRAAPAGGEAHFLAGSPLGTPIERQRFFFSSQSSSARLRFTAAADARRSSSFSVGRAGASGLCGVSFRFGHAAILPMNLYDQASDHPGVLLRVPAAVALRADEGVGVPRW